MAQNSYTSQYLKLRNNDPVLSKQSIPVSTEKETAVQASKRPVSALGQYLEFQKEREATKAERSTAGGGGLNGQQNTYSQGFTGNRESGGYSAAKGLAGVAQKGLGQIAQAGANTAALAEDIFWAPFEFVSGIPLGTISDNNGVANFIQQKVSEENAAVQQNYQANTEKGGKKAEVLENLGTATVAAVPQAVIAMLTGGGSAAAQTTAGLTSAAAQAISPTVSGTVTNAISSMAQNPQYWTSFAQVVGNSYEEALADGASREQAVFNAIGNGLLNAAVEVGGGIETLPGELKNGSNAWKTWVKSALDEGKEEVIQGVIEKAVQNLTYNKNNPLASLTDENALFSPARAAEEFAGGAVVGGILGGGQIAAGRSIDAISRRRGAETAPGAAQAQEQGNIIPQTQEGAQRAAASQSDIMTQEEQRLFGQNNTAPAQAETAVNENGLAAFSQREQENLSSGARNKIISTFQDAVSFVRNALSNRQSMDRAYLGKVPEATARRVQADTGIDIQGFGVMMNGNDIRHIMREHGDLMTEQARGQIAITPDDIARIPEVLASPDRIYLSEDTDGKGRRALVFEKQIGDDYITIQGVSNGKQVLQTDTLYKRKRRTRTARDTMLDTNEGAAPVINAQSEPPQSSSINSIPNSQGNVNGDVPQSVGAAAAGFLGDTERGFSRNISTDQAMESGIRENFQEDPEMYFRLGNRQTLARAQEIFDTGLENARSTLEQAIGQAQAGRKLAPEMVPLSRMVANQLARNGDVYSARKILTDISLELTEAGQLGQAAAILRNADPATRLTMVDKLLERINDKFGKKGREITVDDSLIQQYSNAETDEARDTVMDEIYQQIADQIPSTLMDKFTAIRYLNMLGNLKTQIRNVAGNTAMWGVRSAKTKVQALAEALVSRATGGNFQRTTTLFRDRELYRMAKEDFNSIRAEAMGESKYSDSTRAIPQAIQDRRTIFKNNGQWGTRENSPLIARAARGAADAAWSVLEGYRTLTNRAMEGGDVFFSRRAYADSLSRYLKANGVTAQQAYNGEIDPDFLDQARAHAIREAQEATFRDSNAFSDMIASIGFKNADTIPKKVVNTMAQGVSPFRRTPANVAVRAYEYSPLGIITTAVQAAQKAKGSGDVTGADIVNSLSKTLTGTGIFLLGMGLHSLGLLTAGPSDDDDEAALDSMTGHQDYALELPNGLSITLDWASPAAMPLFMGAEFDQATEDSGLTFADSLAAAGSITNVLMNMSMLQGINDQLSNISYSENPLVDLTLNTLIDYLTQGLTNTLVGQFERASEPERMTTYTDKTGQLPQNIQYELGRASARTPGLDYQQTPYIDEWGQRESEGNLAERIFNNFLNPAYVSQVSEDPLEAEIRRLYEQTGDTAVLPDRAPKKFTVDGEDINLTAEEYDTYARTLGRTRYGLVTQAMQMPEYRRMSDTEKADYIGSLYEYANAVAKSEVSDYALDGWIANARTAPQDIGVSPAEYIALYQRYGSSVMSGTGYDKVKEAVDNGLTVEEYVDYRNSTKDLTSDKDENGKTISGSKKEKVLSAINEMDLSDTEKDWLYYLNGYSESTISDSPWHK